MKLGKDRINFLYLIENKNTYSVNNQSVVFEKTIAIIKHIDSLEFMS
jgi:hypothetical protein